MKHLTESDLAEIQQRVELLNLREGQNIESLADSAHDVPALLAEVRYLRAALINTIAGAWEALDGNWKEV